MSQEVGSAYVRIRPSLAGFKSEATAGVKSALRGVQADVASAARANVAAAREEISANRALEASYKEIASTARAGSEERAVAAKLAADASVAAERRIQVAETETGAAAEKVKHHLIGIGAALGVAFGVEEVIRFTKEITSSAASVQKSVEVIKSSFGKDASEVVVDFADTTAAKLGISAEAANATSARFGILFKNLNIGPDIASKMTVNLEKLAGSLSAIRGVDPSRALSQITLAMLGNVRSLKQLGLAVDPASEKIAAFKLGLIGSVHDALTPAIRAEAIYALATAHLGEFQAQAAKHSNDYANVQRRVSAEWSNAKDILGTELLPEFEKLSVGLGDWLEQMIKTGALQRDVNTVVRDGGAIIGGIKDAIALLLVPVRALVGGLGGVKDATKDLIALWAAWKIAAFIASFRELTTAARLLRLQMLGLKAIGPLVFTATFIGAEKVAQMIKDLQQKMLDAQNAAAGKGSGVRSTLVPSLAREINELKKQGVSSADIIAKLRDRLGGSLKADDIIGDAFAYSTRSNPARKQLLEEFASKLAGDAKKAVTDATKKVSAADAAAVVASAAANAQSAALAKIVTDGKRGISDLQTKLREALQQQERDLTDSINEAKSNLISIGSTLASTIGQAIDQPFVVAGQKIQDAQDRLSLIFDTKNAKLDEQARKLSRLQGKLGLRSDRRALEELREQVVVPGGLSKDPAKALRQLEAIASKHKETRAAVEAFIEKYQAAVLQVRGDRLDLKKGALSDAQAVKETPLQLRSDRLRVGQDAANNTKTRITRGITDLTAELTGGQIKIGEFNRRIAKLLAADGVSYKKAGGLLGFAFRQGFESQVKGILDQATALAAGPQRPGTGQEPKITRPSLVLEKNTAATNALVRQIGNKQTALQTRIAKATEKAAKAAEKSAAAAKTVSDVKLGPTANDLLTGDQSRKSKALTNTTG